MATKKSGSPPGATQQQPSSDFNEKIAKMYSYWTLDCIVELAHAVSNDFIERPREYLDIDVVNELTKLRTYYSIEVLNTQQRQKIFMPIFENSDGYPISVNKQDEKDFHIFQKQLINAANSFTNRVDGKNEWILRGDVEKGIHKFQNQLKLLEGSSFSESYELTKKVFELSVNILKSPKICSIFRAHEIKEQNWPSKYDPQGELLIKHIGEDLNLPSELSHSIERFQFLQNVMKYGALTLTEIIKYNQNLKADEVDKLTKLAYMWGTSLHYFQS